ncbi:MAG TPA: glycerol kinase GlpK [Bacillota bacterium]
MTASYLLALDQGTTSSRAIVFDRDGRSRSLAQREFTQHYPQPGWVEHDADEIWQTQLDVARRAVEEAGIGPGELAAIGLTNQRETTVVWERRTGRPLARAIVWQCRRTAGLCDELRRDGWEERIRQRTGLVIDAYFSGTKLAWLLEHVPGLREKAEQGEALFGTVDTWLIWNLTGGPGGGVHLTDYSNASRTMLFDLHRLDWDDEILARLRIPRAMLPEARPSAGDYGTTAKGVFGAPVRLAGVAGDQQAALFGQGCFAPGLTKNTYGTGCFMLMNTGHRAIASRSGLITTIAWGLGGEVTYALEGSVFIAGAAIQWLRDGLGLLAASGESEVLAASVPDTGGVYFVPAFAGLGAPYWDMYARGAILGLTRGTTRAHLVRAALEAIAYQTKDLIDAMGADAGVVPASLRVDGGAARNDLLLQFQADLLGLPVDRPAVTETTALGAAFLAGLGVGFYPDLEHIAKLRRAERVFAPGPGKAEMAGPYRGWRAAVESARSFRPGPGQEAGR